MADVVGAGLRRASALLAALGVVAIRGDTLLSLKTVITDLPNLTPEQFERAVEEELKGLGSPIPEFRTASARRVPGRKFTYCSLRHPKARDGLLNCADVPDIAGKQLTAEGSIYSNLLGGNLSSSRRVSTDVMQILGKFGLGEPHSMTLSHPPG